ncbi:hypothetical protein MBLNU459_g2886t2 [Dothideomycetes sp. NU459]
MPQSRDAPASGKVYENDSILSFHASRPRKPAKTGAMGLPVPSKRDDFIMDTNSSSIVSKRSVEKLYYAGEAEYFRYFVRKFQRRSPLINRGDPLPFEYLGRHPGLCDQATFVDVDYPQLMQKKHDAIINNPPLLDLLPGLKLQPAGSVVLARSDKYLAIGCDLRQLDKLESVLRAEFNMSECAVEILFTAEVSVAYMTLEAANDVLKWASKFDDVRFCLLEQHLPDGRDHPFAETMLKHFDKLCTPLHAVGTMAEMVNRFTTAGWPASGTNIRSLWELWSDPVFLSPEQRQALDKIEPFDEWEEFALFGCHYFLMVAEKSSSASVAPFLPSVAAKMQDSETAVSEEVAYACVPFEGSQSPRRFASLLPPLTNTSAVESIGLHGGVGTRERLNTCNTYATSSNASGIQSPLLPVALMCHTITPLGESDCLLVGGRTSPDKASAACWYRKDGTWSKVHDLPEGRFRHCAVPFQHIRSSTVGVIVFGGKNSKGNVLDDWLFWCERDGWTRINTVGPDTGSRFGAAIALRHDTTDTGILTGGMRQDGQVIEDYFEFTIDVQEGVITITLTDHTLEVMGSLGLRAKYLGRFGAVLVHSRGRPLLIGGVSASKMLDRRHEILDLQRRRFVEISSKNRPLLVGFSALSLGDGSQKSSGDILILGGGATCFSFGTRWSNSCVLRLANHQDDKTDWHLQDSVSATQVVAPPARSAAPEIRKERPYTNAPSSLTPIERKTIQTAADFELVRNESKPMILTDLDIGSCTKIWTDEYLKSQIGETRPVVVHSSPSPHMNFQTKNFAYTTQPFGNFLDSASNGQHLYLRALSTDKPSEQPTHLAKDFPSIAADFEIPTALQYVHDNAHSSPLRIAGPVTMWLHYDVMANILCQVRGTKRLLLFPPSEVSHLSFPPAASSSTINPFVDAHGAHGFEANLRPGEILFIPPLWLHAAEPTQGLSVAVNVFFREGSMEAGYAAGRDVYGNRDLAAYERGRRDVGRIGKSFEGLPGDVKEFYLRRLADELRGLSAV